MQNIKFYVVGGSVRDVLLGLIPKDIDYVVVGASHEYMIEQGFSKVGASFPVYLHPTTGDEYALARTEKKVGVGYNGFDTVFDSSVTLSQDLYRRDLTINAMAVALEDWEEFSQTGSRSVVIDPYNGLIDLFSGMIRHVSSAFADDPVRLLRAARFAARYKFCIHPDTVPLMESLVDELQYVPKERIWAEFEKGLMEHDPLIMFEDLKNCGAIVPVSGILKPYAFFDSDLMGHITSQTPIEIRFAYCSAGFMDADYDEYKIPNHISRFSKIWNRNRAALYKWEYLTADEKINIFDQMRAFSDKSAAMMIYQAICDYWPTTADWFKTDYESASSVSASDIAKACVNGSEIKQQLFAARANALI